MIVIDVDGRAPETDGAEEALLGEDGVESLGRETVAPLQVVLPSAAVSSPGLLLWRLWQTRQ